MQLPASIESRLPTDPEVRRRWATGAVVILACLLGAAFWWHYMISPWTRDGRVRAEVVTVAAEINGKVTELDVTDNQFVHKGDTLFVIDPEEYRLALAKAAATLESRRQQMLNQVAESDRRSRISVQAVSQEEQETSQSAAAVATAAYNEAQADYDLAQLNMDRVHVVSPVNGYVTNLHLRIGDYANKGNPLLTVIDSDSFWIAGYFEETKIPHIHVGDRAVVKLMGVGPALRGHVESISSGIADPNGGAAGQNLADVNPIFTWVRLAQRIPVRIAIDRVPEGVRIASGMTCTVIVKRGPWR